MIELDTGWKMFLACAGLLIATGIFNVSVGYLFAIGMRLAGF